MGNSSTHQKYSELYSVLRPMKWQKQHWLGQSQLVRDIQTNLKGESYNIPIDNFQQQIPIYQFRKDNSQYIVKVYSVEQASQQILCAGSQLARVVTQRIPFRFSDLGNVGYAEGLYIMQCALRGAKLINNKYLSTLKANQNSPYIHYTDEMICFTQAGQTKIWLTQNLPINHPIISESNIIKSQSVLQSFNIQKKVVRQLMSLVQSRMSGNKFNNYIKAKNQEEQQLVDFQSCIDFVLRMRALQQCEGKSIKSIILPSMVMRSQTDREYGRESSSNNKNNVIDMSKMESSKSSTTSMNPDINKFAVPPRPRKNSKSKSKQKRSNSRSIQAKKPNLKQANTQQSINNNHNQNQIANPSHKISLSSFNHHQNQQKAAQNISSQHQNIHPSAFYHPNNVTPADSNPQPYLLRKKQSSQSNKARSPFKQIAEDSSKQHLQNKINMPSTPSFKNEQISKGDGESIKIQRFPSISSESLPLNKKESNSFPVTNAINTNFNGSAPKTPTIFYPIQSSTTPNSQKNVSFRPVITFNSSVKSSNNINSDYLNSQIDKNQTNILSAKANTTRVSNQINIEPKIPEINKISPQMIVKQQSKTITSQKQIGKQDSAPSSVQQKIQPQVPTKISNVINFNGVNINKTSPAQNYNQIQTNNQNQNIYNKATSNNQNSDAKNYLFSNPSQPNVNGNYYNTDKINKLNNNTHNINYNYTNNNNNNYNNNNNSNNNSNNNNMHTNYNQKPAISFQTTNTQSYYNSNNPLSTPTAGPNFNAYPSVQPSFSSAKNIQINNYKQTNSNNNLNTNKSQPSYKITYNTPSHQPYPITNNLTDIHNDNITGKQATNITRQQFKQNQSRQFAPNRQIQQRIYKVLNRGLLADKLIEPQKPASITNLAINKNYSTTNNYITPNPGSSKNIVNISFNTNQHPNPYMISNNKPNQPVYNDKKYQVQQNQKYNKPSFNKKYSYDNNSSSINNTNTNNITTNTNTNTTNNSNNINKYLDPNSTDCTQTNNNTSRKDVRKYNILEIGNNTVSLYNSNASFDQFQGQIQEI